ncbi:MAG: DnrO protein [Proteobacteria bacterium]|nr:DnrO protein [Pseudomonadota bacterium]
MTTPRSLPAIAAAMLALTLAPASRAQHDHTAHAHITAPVPPPTTRWPADPALRDGMGRIHTALDELRHFEMGHIGAEMAKERAEKIEHAAADIFARCKLTPERDAVLHGMLMPLLSAAAKLKADPNDVGEVAAMRRAVADYPRYFDDPGWSLPTKDEHAAHD